MAKINHDDRRRFLKYTSAMMLTGLCGYSLDLASSVPPLHQKHIPATGESIPAIGMGSWITFNVGEDPVALANCVQILNTFFQAGGSLIDSSPMYGSSEQVIGHCLKSLNRSKDNFSATKVWSPFQSLGETQINNSYELWHTQEIDLLQIHNLLGWQRHLETLKQLKADKKIRYIGITTSHGRRHDELEQIMLSQPLDFIQLTYNVLDREAEQRLLPLARERGIAVVVNRPFQRNGLFERVADKPLPSWASEIQCHSWAQFFLKFIISHPAVTCAIPATSQVAHMQENMAVLQTPLPDQLMREKMLSYLRTL